MNKIEEYYDEKNIDKDTITLYDGCNDYLRALIVLSEQNTPANKAKTDELGEIWEKLVK